MNKPLVSTIIPAYNCERYLPKAIESVLAQTYKPFEVIVVDDGSVDGTADIAKSYKEVRYIYQMNQGHGTAKNAGIAASKGEFLAFLDADDLWTPDKLRVQVDYLVNHPDVGYSISKMQIFLESGTELPKWLDKDWLSEGIPAYIPSALVVRKSVIEEIGGFDPTYRHGNDTDWLFRAKDSGISMTILPEILLYRRIHSSNLSYETRAMTLELLRLIKSSIDRKRNQKSSSD